MRRVVITGLGIISSIGNNTQEVLHSLQHGCSGIEFIPERKELGFRSALGGTLKNVAAPDIPKKFLRQMNRSTQLAVHAVQQALDDAQLSQHDIQHERTGLMLGNMGNMQDIYNSCR